MLDVRGLAVVSLTWYLKSKPIESAMFVWKYCYQQVDLVGGIRGACRGAYDMRDLMGIG